ncbi:hypothetical protein U1Q18_045101, partial [Sarracenia purpurea var. burkii]
AARAGADGVLAAGAWAATSEVGRVAGVEATGAAIASAATAAAGAWLLCAAEVWATDGLAKGTGAAGPWLPWPGGMVALVRGC